MELDIVNMKRRFILYRRKSTYYCEDTLTGKQQSLGVKDRVSAERLLHAKNEAEFQPAMNLQIARAYMAGSDPAVASRTWTAVMEEMRKLKRGSTLERWTYAIQDSAFDSLRDLAVIETRAEQFLRVLEVGTVSTNHHLRRLYNFALDMGWLPWSIIPKKRWPRLRHKTRRAITWEEHQTVVEREPNLETRAFYQLLWHLGGSQSDVATLKGEDVDWNARVIGYHRQKTGSIALLRFGENVAAILNERPRTGFLFPRLAMMHEKHRAKQFRRRTLGLGIDGVSLHSYRYAWAERAKQLGFPERYAQEALGHNSKAVHRAYARKARMELPSLEEYEAAKGTDPTEERPIVLPPLIPARAS